MKAINHEYRNNGVIYLIHLPFWTPLIPPQGIARLKTYLQDRGYQSITLDLNVDYEAKSSLENIFKLIRDIVPGYQWGNFYDNAYEVIKNITILVANTTNPETKFQMIRKIFSYYYLYDISNEDSMRMVELIEEYFLYLEDSIVKKIVEDPHISALGVSLHSGNLGSSLYVLKRIKEERTDIKTVVGGSVFMGELRYNTPDFSRFLKKTDKLINHYIIGAGERAFLYLLENRFKTEKRIIIADPEKDSRIGFSIKPNLDDFDMGNYPYLASYASKSCPNACSFCNERSFMGEYTERNVKVVVDEIEKSSRKYQKNMIFMLDVLMNNYISEFSKELVSRDVSCYFDGYIRVADELADRKHTQLWRDAGFYRARLGIESGSQKILDLINKKITVSQIVDSLKGLATTGIKTTTYLVIGHPGETDDDFQKTMNLITECQENIWQAEPHLFRYFYDGQSGSGSWAKHRRPLFTDEELDSIIIQTYYLDLFPNHEIGLRRMWKTMEHLKSTGIINPHTVYDKYKADERWIGLHRNSVPSVAEVGELEINRSSHEPNQDFLVTDLNFENNFLF
ncbi:MAG: radical SAM protein [Marinifilaceae bacterium]